MIKLFATGLATVDAMREMSSLRDVALAKAAKVRYVRDIIRDGKNAFNIANRVRGAIHVGRK